MAPKLLLVAVHSSVSPLPGASHLLTSALSHPPSLVSFLLLTQATSPDSFSHPLCSTTSSILLTHLPPPPPHTCPFPLHWPQVPSQSTMRLRQRIELGSLTVPVVSSPKHTPSRPWKGVARWWHTQEEWLSLCAVGHDSPPLAGRYPASPRQPSCLSTN